MPGFEFGGSVAVVTGGAGGIGAALAAAVASEGARVGVVDLDLDRASGVAGGLPGARGFAADVGDAGEVRAMVGRVEEELGPIDLYFSNAGVATGRDLGDEGAWEASWRVHVLAHVHAAGAVLPGMESRGRGAFVVTASAAGLLMMMQSAPYTVTKHGSVAVAEWLAVNHGGADVQFHCLCPQGVRTPMVAADASGESEVAASGDILEPEQVARDVLEAIRANRFLILPHPEVHGYEEAKVADRDRWLAGMRRLRTRLGR